MNNRDDTATLTPESAGARSLPPQASPAPAEPPATRLLQPDRSILLDNIIRQSPRVDHAADIHAMAIMMLEDAVRERASDIHLDPLENGYELRFRIDGVLVDTLRLGSDDGLHLVRSLKSQAGLEPAFELRPQTGRVTLTVGGRPLSVRLATAPGVRGEKMALRLLPAEFTLLTLGELGLSEVQHDQLRNALHEVRGMILVSGPTGAGKTSTIYALARELLESNRSIVSIEDPVEYVLDRVTQIQVNEKQGLTFEEGLKAVLRLDPDVIIMGEMRDQASARATLTAAEVGHVFLSTLHARDAAGTITVLRNFGFTDHEIAAALDLIIAQRLVRRLCSACRRKEAPTEPEKKLLQFYGHTVPAETWHAVGCAKCGGSGYHGRVGVFELHRFSEEDANLVLSHADEHTLRTHLRNRGALSLIDGVLAKAEAGITSLSEVQRVGGLGFHTPRGAARRT